MQRLCGLLMTGVSLLVQLNVTAQGKDSLQVSGIQPYMVSVGFNKTSNLIFPYAIKSVDRGSADVIVQKAKGVENILQVKANKQGFAETNLSVMTTDGKFYSFLVNYLSDPVDLNILFNPKGDRVLLSDAGNAQTMETAGEEILNAVSFIHAIKRSQLLQLDLQSIYLNNELMWFCFKLSNGSLIPFHPRDIRFFLEDRKHAKRTAVQEQELAPLYHTPICSVGGNGWMRFAYAFKPFVIPRSKRMVVLVQAARAPAVPEGRRVGLKVRPGKILKARCLYQ